MSRPGWIKLYNQTLDSDFWIDVDMPFDWRSAFIHVLLSANWRPGISRRGGHTITVERGQLLTSIRKLGATFHWDKHKVYQWLKFMAAADMVTYKSIGFGTLLTIVNYGKYQNDSDTPTHTVAHTPTHEDTHTPTHTVAPRSKTIDIRQQTEDSLSAHAGPPPAERIEPPRGSPEWYALHNDD